MNKLSLGQKIISIALIGSISFSVYVVYIFYMAGENQNHIESISEVKFPVLERYGQIRTLVTKINGEFGSALREDDEYLINELMTQLDGQSLTLTKLFNSIKQIDPASVVQISKIANLYSAYFTLTKSLVLTVSGQADEIEDLQQGFEKMHALETQLERNLEEFRDIRFEEFEAALAYSRLLGFSMVSRGLMLGALTITLLLAFGIWVSMVIKRQINQVAASLLEMSSGKGDLTFRIKQESNDELGTLVNNFNLFVAHLQNLITQVADSSVQVSTGTLQLKLRSKQTREGCQQQQEEVAQAVMAVDQLSVSAQQVMEIAESAATLAREAIDESETSKVTVVNNIGSITQLTDSLQGTRAVIDRLSEDSNNINGIMEVLKTIADQTNLLALNAAIEAARAGEAGRGFAVVADEVRTLAERTAGYTIEIQDILQSLRTGAMDAVEAMDKAKSEAEISVQHSNDTGKTLDAIISLIEKINKTNSSVAAASMDQNNVIQEITKNINAIDGVVKKTLTLAELTASASNTTGLEVEKQQSVVENFTL